MCHVASRARTSQPQIGWGTLFDALVREPVCATPPLHRLRTILSTCACLNLCTCAFNIHIREFIFRLYANYPIGSDNIFIFFVIVREAIIISISKWCKIFVNNFQTENFLKV